MIARRSLLAGLAAALALGGRADAQSPAPPVPQPPSVQPPSVQPLAARPEPDPRLVAAADQIAFGYVVTGDAEVDRASAAGLDGLGLALYARTTVEPGPPVAIDLDEDDLTLLTFLYWPVTATQGPPSPQAYLRLNQFLRTGGVILFDTRDGDIAGVGMPADAAGGLRDLAAPLEVPPLAPLPANHVLSRSFYLLDDLPGRYQGQQIWVEAAPVPAEGEVAEGPLPNRNDGVSPVIIGGNAWAEAWAIGADGLPLYTVGRGFEGERQRELALRAGVNMVMYVLTGNYKSDQVHVPALLERLGLEEGGAPADADAAGAFGDLFGGGGPRPGTFGDPPAGGFGGGTFDGPPSGSFGGGGFGGGGFGGGTFGGPFGGAPPASPAPPAPGTGP